MTEGALDAGSVKLHTQTKLCFLVDDLLVASVAFRRLHRRVGVVRAAQITFVGNVLTQLLLTNTTLEALWVVELVVNRENMLHNILTARGADLGEEAEVIVATVDVAVFLEDAASALEPHLAVVAMYAGDVVTFSL